MSQKKGFPQFLLVLECGAYILLGHKQNNLQELPAGVSSIVLIGALTRCALLHSVCDLKASLMNLQSSLIWGLLLYWAIIPPKQ